MKDGVRGVRHGVIGLEVASGTWILGSNSPSLGIDQRHLAFVPKRGEFPCEIGPSV